MWAETYPWRAPGPNVVRDIADQVREAIRSGAFAPGTKLPPSRALAVRLGVARASVVAAVDWLAAEGLVRGRTGSGVYVVGVDAPDPEVLARRAGPTIIPARAAAIAGQAWSVDTPAPRPFVAGRTLMDERAQAAWRKAARTALARLGPEHFSYGDPRGDAALRGEICRYLAAARGVVAAPDQVIITCGTQHGLDLVARTLLQRGDGAWVEDPGYAPTYATLAAMGAAITPVPVDAAGLDVDTGRAMAPSARLAVVTASHQWPLGITLSLARRHALLAWAREADAWIVEDDYASEYRYGGPPLTALQGLDGGERVIYLGTLNKTLFPGLRLGFLVAPRALTPALAAARQMVDRLPSSLTQAILLEFIRSGEFAGHIRRRRQAYARQRDALVRALGHRLGNHLEIPVPDQGMHLIALLRNRTDDVALEQRALQQGLIVRALSPLYHCAPPRAGFQLGFSGFPPEDLEAGVERLAAVLDHVPISGNRLSDQNMV
jgi:GntR family transcriptional regulator / MocR family aminotransferase